MMPNEDKADDLVSVLRNMGYKKVEAERRAIGVLEQHSDADVTLETLIKEALAWSYHETGSLKVVPQDEAGAKGGTDLPLPPKPRIAKLVYVPQEQVEDDQDEQESTSSGGGGVLLGILAVFGILAGVIMWIGIAKFAMVLAGLITFFFIIGKMGKDKDE